MSPSSKIASQELPPQVHEVPEMKKGSGKVETFETSVVGNRKAKLRSDGPEVELVPVNVPGLIESRNNQMVQTDQSEAAKAGKMIQQEDETAVETIEDQLEKGEVEGTKVLLFSEACRQFGEVYAVKGEVNMAKYGHKIETGNSGQFVIPQSRGPEMQSLLKNLCTGVGGAEGAFHIETKNTFDKEDGFEAVYRYVHNGKPQEIRFAFFYFDDIQENPHQRNKKPQKERKEETVVGTDKTDENTVVEFPRSGADSTKIKEEDGEREDLAQAA